jgi:hypothetical protein
MNRPASESAAGDVTVTVKDEQRAAGQWIMRLEPRRRPGRTTISYHNKVTSVARKATGGTMHTNYLDKEVHMI